MSKYEKLLTSILSGRNDKNIRFTEFRNLIVSLGFTERIVGDHFIYNKKDVDEILNIQPDRNMAKPYQVKQVRTIILKYKLGGNENA